MTEAVKQLKPTINLFFLLISVCDEVSRVIKIKNQDGKELFSLIQIFSFVKS